MTMRRWKARFLLISLIYATATDCSSHLEETGSQEGYVLLVKVIWAKGEKKLQGHDNEACPRQNSKVCPLKGCLDSLHAINWLWQLFDYKLVVGVHCFTPGNYHYQWKCDCCGTNHCSCGWWFLGPVPASYVLMGVFEELFGLSFGWSSRFSFVFSCACCNFLLNLLVLVGSHRWSPVISGGALRLLVVGLRWFSPLISV